MKFLINILLIMMILFSGLNSYALGKKKSIEVSSSKVRKEVVKKKKEPKVKKEKVKKIKPAKSVEPESVKAPTPTKVKTKKVKKEKVSKVKKEKKSKKEKAVKAKTKEQTSEKDVKPVKNKKNKTTVKSTKDLQNLSQSERERIMVEQQYRYKQRSKLAMKLNPNLDVLEIRASHILVKNRKDAVNIRKDILNGTISFEDAAMQYSLCPTGARGGDLGYFNRKKMDRSFTDRAFDLKIGEISDPVGTKFGWHIIKVVDKR